MASKLICTLSGASIKDPVVSGITGHVYERSSIIKYIDLNQSCPITGQPMDSDQLISLNCDHNSFSRPITTCAVPNLIQGIQDQWDETAIEIMALKQHLQKVRKELSHTLYQQDAACRVISRLIKERDGAVNKYNDMVATFGDPEQIKKQENKSKVYLNES